MATILTMSDDDFTREFGQGIRRQYSTASTVRRYNAHLDSRGVSDQVETPSRIITTTYDPGSQGKW